MQLTNYLKHRHFLHKNNICMYQGLILKVFVDFLKQNKILKELFSFEQEHHKIHNQPMNKNIVLVKAEIIFF